jgi:effector-binding domain-containing protein
MELKLTERYIINLMKEEWDKKVRSLLENKGLEVKVDVDKDGQKESVISQGLKVVKKKPSQKGKLVKDSDPLIGTLYTVDSVNDHEGTITLSRADQNGKDKKTIVVTTKEFEDNYKRK